MNFAPKHIYFLRPVGHEGPIKIGCSAWPADRLRVIAHWSPIPLELAAHALGDHTLERALHRKFAATRSHKEWFLASDELTAGIAAVAAGALVADAFGFATVLRNSKYRSRVVYRPAEERA
jgi:hypothetical protein